VRVEALKKIDDMRDRIREAYRMKRDRTRRYDEEEEDMTANRLNRRRFGYYYHIY